MTKSIPVSEEFYELVAAHSREGESMEETLRRLIGAPSPEMLERALPNGDDTAAEEIREAIERGRETGRTRTAELRERFEEDHE